MIRFSTFIFMVFALLFGKNTILRTGDIAPDFTLNDQDGKAHTLSDYRGENIIVYFYLKDGTPG